jgi:hypothetical protein
MRTVTLKEFVIEEFNRMLAEEGRDVRIVTERPKPKLTGKVVELWPQEPIAGDSGCATGERSWR